MPKRPDRKAAEEAVRTLIAWAGDSPDRDGLIETPRRVLDAYAEFFAGYQQDANKELARTFEARAGYDDIVLVRDIPFTSHCEHHMLPFIGRAHLAYYPEGRVVGLSKLARTVDVYAHRLQTQERLTAEIAQAVNRALKPRGIAVLIQAEHQCMTLRGVRKPGTLTTTTMFLGAFKDPAEQVRFLGLVGAERDRWNSH